MTLGHSLAAIVEAAQQLHQVSRRDLHFGDQVAIKTQNSLYLIQAVEGDFYVVSGGWFDREGLSPLKTTINGCTWGGSIIKMDVVAACDLCLEFGNRVVTSPIQKVVLIPGGLQN